MLLQITQTPRVYHYMLTLIEQMTWKITVLKPIQPVYKIEGQQLVHSQCWSIYFHQEEDMHTYKRSSQFRSKV